MTCCFDLSVTRNTGLPTTEVKFTVKMSLRLENILNLVRPTLMIAYSGTPTSQATTWNTCVYLLILFRKGTVITELSQQIPQWPAVQIRTICKISKILQPFPFCISSGLAALSTDEPHCIIFWYSKKNCVIRIIVVHGTIQPLHRPPQGAFLRP